MFQIELGHYFSHKKIILEFFGGKGATEN